MICRGGYKESAFLRCVSWHLCPGEGGRYSVLDGGEVYFGSGYWRGYYNGHGVRLVNPDCGPDECRTVEKAIGVLAHLEIQA